MTGTARVEMSRKFITAHRSLNAEEGFNKGGTLKRQTKRAGQTGPTRAAKHFTGGQTYRMAFRKKYNSLKHSGPALELKVNNANAAKRDKTR